MPAVDLERAFRGKQVLVTGGMGFIGSNLARRLLLLGAEPTLVDTLDPDLGGNPYNIADVQGHLRAVVGDIRDESVMKPLFSGLDYLFNLAARTGHAASMQDPLADLQVNAAGQVALLELCRKVNPAVRIVYAGTRQVYGRPQRLPVDETHPLAPPDFNGVSKLAAEEYHLVCHRAYGMRTSSLRMTNVYGPRMRVRDANNTFVGLWFRQLIEGREITVYGDGRQLRDLNYVDDVVEALLLCAASGQAEGQVYNLGAEPVSLLELAQLMVAVNGGGSYRLEPFPPERRRIDIGDYYGDPARARAQLGWEPSIPLREGLARTLAYYREFGGHYW